ncbi:flagellar basal body rod protein FlgB [Endothiovibrio diazotrophicus]
MAINIDKLFGVFDDAMVLRARRGEILASNMANADTPGYKARDFDFRAALDQASSGTGPMRRTNPQHIDGSYHGLSTTHANHLALVRPDVSIGQLDYRNPSQPSLDGNTVDTEQEKARFAENALQYRASMSFLSGKISSMKELLKEK